MSINNRTKIYNNYYVASVDAQALTLLRDMSRSNVNYELNMLVKESKITKSSGRPFLFFLKDAISDKNKMTKLDELIMYNISLKAASEQAKAAILYPPKGLSSLVLGDTGVGKSMFASLMYNYAVEMGIKEKDSPFILFNCADYCNNPQLLVAQLFRCKEGTYTGAESDKAGLIETADGGILFLDEVAPSSS